MIEFMKMHGLGNDFIVIDTRDQQVSDDASFYKAICDRKRGIGCDQLVLICAPRDDKSDLYVRLINREDGLEVGMCGNALRCVAGAFWDVVERRDPEQLIIATQSGHYPARKIDEQIAQVMMGQAKTGWQEIPLREAQDTLNIILSDMPQLPVAGAMNIGNPHIAFVTNDVMSVPLTEWGPQIEHHPLLPERANVEFIQVMDRHTLRMRVWERSAGITEACGSGACAAAWIAAQRGLVQSPVTVIMDGGRLTITIDSDGTIHQTGPYALAFTGQIAL